MLVEHVLIESTISGRAQGTARTELWLAAESGLLIRETRRVRTQANEFAATIDYREDASFQIVSLTSQR
jgi:hypothetical protein